MRSILLIASSVVLFAIFGFFSPVCIRAEDSLKCHSEWTGFAHNGKQRCYKVFYHQIKKSYHYRFGYYNPVDKVLWAPDTFAEAQKRCKSESDNDGHLVCIQSREEYSFIRALIVKSAGTDSGFFNMSGNYEENRFWTGLQLERDENGTAITVAKWVNGKSATFGNPVGLAKGSGAGQFPWGMDAGYGGEPNNLQGDENCVAIGASIKKDGLIDVPCCEKLKGFICEREPPKKVCTSWDWKW